jgi:hypothetical protein
MPLKSAIAQANVLDLSTASFSNLCLLNIATLMIAKNNNS